METVLIPQFVPIAIEKGIPIPPKYIHYSEIPFDKMEVGDSIFITKRRFRKTSLLDLKQFLWRKSREYSIDTAHDIKVSFHIDRINDGVRCWRIE